MISSTLEATFDQYAKAFNLSDGTRNEYHTTLSKWRQWGGELAINKIGRKKYATFSTGSMNMPLDAGEQIRDALPTRLGKPASIDVLGIRD